MSKLIFLLVLIFVLVVALAIWGVWLYRNRPVKEEEP